MKYSNASVRCLVALFGFLAIALPSCHGEETCDAEGSCTASEQPPVDTYSCGGSTYIYGNAGSAQAYRPGAPLSNVVCRPEIANEYRYKPSTWPFYRRSLKKSSSPILDVTMNFWSCEEETCSCQRLSGQEAEDPSSLVEVWQALPNGGYPPLTGSNPTECRAQVPVTSDGMAKFTTVAPGSTGTMGGLGPNGMDWSPYGPPVVHLLAQVAGHAPLLLDVPILPNPKTWEYTDAVSSDLRGVAWIRSRPNEMPYTVKTWEASMEEGRIQLELDVYLHSSPDDQAQLCQSFLYGFPTSFFLEPISVCAPSMLEFFAL